MRRLIRIVLFLVPILLLLSIAAVLVVQAKFSSLLQDYVRDHYGLMLKIGSAELRFSPLSVRLEHIEVSATGAPPFAKAASASAELPYSSLWEDEFLVREVSIDSPDVNLETLARLESKQGKPGSGVPAFRVEEISVHSGSVAFRGYNIRDIDAQAQIDSTGLMVRQLKARTLGIDITTHGNIQDWSSPRADLVYAAAGDIEEVARLYLPESRIRGPVSVQGEVHGGPADMVLSGKTDRASLTVNGHDPFEAAAEFKLSPAEKERPVDVDVTWQSFPLAILRHYRSDLPELDATSNGRAHYSGGLDPLAGAGHVSATLAGTSDSLSGQVEASLDHGLVRVEKAEFRIGSSIVHATGTLNRQGLQARTEIQSTRLADFSRWYGPAARIPGRWSADVEIAGPYQDIGVKGQVSGVTGRSDVRAVASLSLKRQALDLTFQGHAAAEDLRPYAASLTEGDFRLSGSANGSWANPEVHAAIHGSALRVSGFPVGDVILNAAGNLNLVQLSVDLPDYKTTADASYAARSGKFRVEGRLHEFPMAQLHPFLPATNELNGSFSGTLDADGDVDHIEKSNVHFHFEQAAFQWRGAAIALADGSSVGVENEVATMDVHAVMENGDLLARGFMPLDPDKAIDLNLEGKVSAAALEKLDARWKADGAARWKAVVRGSRNHPQAFGDFSADNLSFTYVPGNRTVRIDRAAVLFSGERVELSGSGSYRNARFHWNGAIPMDESTGSLHAEIDSVPVQELAQEFGQDVPLSGTLAVVADLQGAGFPLKSWKPGKIVDLPFHEWTSRIVVSPADLKFGQYPILVEAPLQLDLAGRNLRLSPFKISSGDMLDLHGSGNLNLETGKIESAMKLLARIDLLSSLNANVQSSGPLAVDLTAGGTLAQPEVNGTVTLSNASLHIPGSPVSFEKIELAASFNQDRIRIDRLEARSGGGTVTGGGELVRGAPATSLWFSGRKVAMMFPEGLRSQSNADLKVTATRDRLYLSGDIVVLRSIYDRELNFRNPLVRQLLSSQAQLASEKYARSRVSLAINVRTEDDFVLKNTLAAVRAAANLKIEGTLYQPRSTGWIQIREGSRFFITGKTYVVEKARLDLFRSEMMDPNLDVEISTLAQDMDNNTFYEVFVRLGGSLSSLEVQSVRSNPTLSETQIYGLLTRGTISASSSDSSMSGLFREQLLSAFTGQVLSVPASKMARSIGLSRVNVQQEGLSSVNDSKTRLILSKDVGAGFSLVYSFVLNEPEDYTWLATYRYQNKFFMRYIGQDDGTYTASINHRIAFGPGSPGGSVTGGAGKRFQPPVIVSLDLSNQSPMSDQQIRDVLSISAGSRFDYWNFSERMERLKAKLQSLGYLSPTVEVDETDLPERRVSLRVDVVAGDAAEMTFSGYTVNARMTSRYLKWWAQGISPLVVQEMIEEDLVRELNDTGYQKATVAAHAETRGAKTVYSFAIQQGPRFQTVELKFQGTRIYSAESLQAELRTLFSTSADMFTDAIHDPSSVAEKVRVLYMQRGYAGARASVGPLTFDSSAGRIVREFTIQEGEPVRVAAVSASTGEIPEDLRKTLRVRVGQGVVFQDFLDDGIAICNYYENLGHQGCSSRYRVQFTNENRDLTVDWMIETDGVARIASLRVAGCRTTRPELVLKQSGLREGEILTALNQSVAQKRLYDLGVFTNVSIEKEETSTPGLYDVTVRVSETKPYELQYGARYNTDDKLGAELRLADNNFLGRAQHLSFYGRTDLDEPLFRLDYMLPRTGAFWSGLRVSFFRDKRNDEVDAIVDHELYTLPYQIKETQFQVQQATPLGSNIQIIWDFNYGPETVGARQGSEFEDIAFHGRRTLFHLAFLGDYRDDAFNASRGYFYSIDGQAAPDILGSDILYEKTYGQLFVYRKVGPVVFASAIRAGFLHARSDVFTLGEKFRTGGSTTLRGFELNSVYPPSGALGALFGGDSVFIINEELRFPVYKWITAAVFYDGGNVYEYASDFDPTDLRHSAGFGFRAGGGGFLLRFDLGFNLFPRPEESHAVFYFAIGQAF